MTDDVRPQTEPLTHADMAALLGYRPGPKVELVLIGERLFHRDAHGGWWEYPERPER